MAKGTTARKQTKKRPGVKNKLVKENAQFQMNQ